LRYLRHVVPFDTGVGKDPVYGWFHSGLLLRSMAAAGVATSEVTKVVLPHTDSNNAWCLVDDRGVPNVPEARVFVPRLDCDLWTDLANVALCRCTGDSILGAQCNLLAYQDRLFDGDAEILPDVRAVASRGHCFYVIGTGQDR
jgi:hypothetical protein